MSFDFNALRGMSDPEDMIRHLEGLRAQAEQQLASLEGVRNAIAAIEITCSDPEGLVTVTVGSDGYLRALTIAQEVTRRQYRLLGPAVIAALEEARRQLEEALQQVRPR